MQYYEDIQPWVMDNKPVSVKEDNDHLGLIVSGYKEEEKNIDLKIKKARGSLFKLLGPAFSSKCLLSPAVQIHLYKIYICPISRSGLSGMTLRENHLEPLMSFQKKVFRGFLHLSDRSPIPSLYFLTGDLPIVAKLHRDIFSVFFNIWINPQTKIFEIIRYLLQNSPDNSHTWARHIRNLAIIYEMEDPAELIEQTPQTKNEFGNYVLTKITVHYEKKLRLAAKTNSKMKFLNVNVKGLNGRVHPALSGLLSTQDVQKARSHIKMLCDDLYTYERKAEYQGGSPHCRFCLETNLQNSENIIHIITECSLYKDARQRILPQIEIICSTAKSEVCFQDILSNQAELAQFLLDCTSLNLKNRISEKDEVCQALFKLARDFCSSIMKKRNQKLKILKKT